MTPAIHQTYLKLKLFTDSMCGLLLLMDPAEFKKFENDARVYADGTMSPIMLHSMSLRDLNTSEKNLSKAILVSQKLRELRELLITEPETPKTDTNKHLCADDLPKPVRSIG